MANHDQPAGAFRFELAFAEHRIGADAPGGTRPLCGGAFAECTGLEATHEPKLIREGGRNYGAHQRAGSVSFATVILRRGITSTTDLWRWFELTTLRASYGYRLDVEVRHLDVDGTPMRTWRLERAMPSKLKSSDLNAKSADIAIEEIHLVHEGLTLVS